MFHRNYISFQKHWCRWNYYSGEWLTSTCRTKSVCQNCSENCRTKSGVELSQFCDGSRRSSDGALRSFSWVFTTWRLLLPAVSWPLFINQRRDNSEIIFIFRKLFVAVTVSLEIEIGVININSVSHHDKNWGRLPRPYPPSFSIPRRQPPSPPSCGRRGVSN